eukprot:956773-Amphidinium_carterae.1
MSVRMRIIQQVVERLNHADAHRLTKDVPALQVLSRALFSELRYCLFAKHVHSHLLFRSWTSLDEECVRHLCNCMETDRLVLRPDDELFHAHKDAESAYYIIQGSFLYDMHVDMHVDTDSDGEAPTKRSTHGGGGGLMKKATHDVELVRAGGWMCEATWWCYWHHVGSAAATEPCTILCVSPTAVKEAMELNIATAAIGLEYARLLHQRLVNAGTNNLPSDVALQNAEFTDILLSMPRQAHIVLGVAAMQHTQETQPYWYARKVRGLEQEVRNGRSIVLLDKEWNLQRQVALTLLKIQTSASTTLAQLA